MQAKGRFVENDITPPGAAGCTLVSLTARPDGGLDYIALRPAETPGQYTYTHFYSADSGKEWTENTMDWQESFGEKRQIEKVTVTPEGEYFVMLTEQTEDGMGAVAYARVAADGTAVPVQPEGLSAQGGLVAADAQVLPGGRLLLTSFGGRFCRGAERGCRGRRRRAGGIFRHAGRRRRDGRRRSCGRHGAVRGRYGRIQRGGYRHNGCIRYGHRKKSCMRFPTGWEA